MAAKRVEVLVQDLAADGGGASAVRAGRDTRRSGRGTGERCRDQLSRARSPRSAEADFDRVLGANLRSAMFCSQHACARMAAAGIAGRIINITSGNYRYTRPNAGLYAASKAALEMLTRSFALEHGRQGITVNAVAPGLIARPSETDPGFVRVASYYQDNSPVDGLVSSADVASTVMFLASERAAMITGESLVIDGGFSIGRFDFPRRTS